MTHPHVLSTHPLRGAGRLRLRRRISRSPKGRATGAGRAGPQATHDAVDASYAISTTEIGERRWAEKWDVVLPNLWPKLDY